MYRISRFLLIHSIHLDLLYPQGACVNTVGDTIWMVGEPWFSYEVGKDIRKREKGGEKYYRTEVKKASLVW